MAVMLLMLACGTQVSGPPASEEAVPKMEAVDLLTRVSLDLRGVRPSEEEMAAVEADPAQVESYIDTFMDDPRFGSRVRALFSDIYLTRQDAWTVRADEFYLDDEPGFARSVGEEPLRVLSYIAENDLPYTDIVTADWTMADELLGQAYPLDYPEGETGWKQVHYTDSRPAAGVLSTNGFWWHYTTNLTNSNRGRANAVSKVFLCNDYLSRPISFSRDVNLLDRDALNDALQNNPGCYACHSSLDPLASYLWGFYYINSFNRLDMTSYHPERERLWQQTSELAPGYYGEPGTNLSDLGWQIAGDARFPQCITEQAYKVLLQRDTMLEDTEEISNHREALLAGDMRLKPLFRSVLSSDNYRAASDTDPRWVPKKLMGPELLASQVEDLTGFRYVYQGYDMMLTDSYGVRILAGGVDGVYATTPAVQPTTTSVLVQERLAQAAASYAVEQDAANPSTARLFTEINFSETPDSDQAAMIRQIQKLHRRLFGKQLSEEDAEIQENLDLWTQLNSIEGDTKKAWAGLLSVLLRDPDFILY